MSNNEVNFSLSCHFQQFSCLYVRQRVTTLDVGSNGVGDEGIQHLAIALKSNKVSTSRSLMAQYKYLEYTQTLTTLNLSSNQIGTVSAKYLAETIGYTTVKFIVELDAFFYTVIVEYRDLLKSTLITINQKWVEYKNQLLLYDLIQLSDRFSIPLLIFFLLYRH